MEAGHYHHADNTDQGKQKCFSLSVCVCVFFIKKNHSALFPVFLLSTGKWHHYANVAIK